LRVLGSHTPATLSQFKSNCNRSNPIAEHREFATGAIRDTEQDKLDYEGFLSPVVLERYAQYMHKNRTMLDGSLRDSDNWQKGIPINVYMKSLWRHFMEVWTDHRKLGQATEEALCAVLFNTMGYLHEVLTRKPE
jgi:hypothetical protein